MRRTATLMLLAVLALGTVAPAQADKGGKPHKPKTPAGQQTPKPNPPKPPTSNKCAAHHAGYNATGTLVSSALIATGGGRYSGPLEVDVSKANHRAPSGDQMFTLTNVKVSFSRGVSNPAPAGSRVKLHGKITELPKKCPTSGFTPTITLKKVDISPKHAKH